MSVFEVVVFGATFMILYGLCGTFIDLSNDDYRAKVEDLYFQTSLEEDGVPPESGAPMPSKRFSEVVAAILLVCIHLLPIIVCGYMIMMSR